MAILSKIREKSVFLIVVVGLALFAFVLDPSTLQDFFSSSKVNVVGEVNGESITRQEYAAALDAYRTNTQSRVSDMQAARTVWDNLLRNKIYTYQLEEAGITIGENDIWEEIIRQPFVQNNPEFKNELGIFDEDKLKLFILEMQEAQDQSRWQSWQDYLKTLETNLKRDTYNNLVNAGLGASLKEGRYEYEEDNTFLSGDFVHIPFSSIPDSIVRLDKSEIEAYVKDHPNDFQVEASRDLSYLTFEIKATQEDKDTIKANVAKVIEDAVDRNQLTIPGFKNATDYQDFFDEFESDLPFREEYRMKAQLPASVAEQIASSKEGDIVGPYEDRNFYKLTKIVEVVKRPDSVKASHILIPFVGSAVADATTTQTEEEAKKSADSILKLVRRNKKKFAEIADAYNKNPRAKEGGDLGWIGFPNAFATRADKSLAMALFDNKAGELGVVTSPAGVHVYRIDEQKNKQNSFKIVTYGKEILPSEKTGQEIYREVENFLLELAGDGKTFYDVARQKGYKTKPAIGLKILEEKIPGVAGTNRQVVTWAFDKESSVGDFKRFDMDNGYIVALLTGKTEEGLMSAAKASGRVRPILMNQKKAEIIKAKMTGATLNDIAVANKVTVRKMNDVSLKSPSIPGVGSDAKVVGAMYYAKENELYNKVEGARGVFAFVITKKESPTALSNYEPNRNQLAQERKNMTVKIFDALKETSDIQDDRAYYHGVNQ
jgi:peptidylprolyl isomerase/peptidyl-prolyl cis-trans isomerase D